MDPLIKKVLDTIANEVNAGIVGLYKFEDTTQGLIVSPEDLRDSKEPILTSTIAETRGAMPHLVEAKEWLLALQQSFKYREGRDE